MMDRQESESCLSVSPSVTGIPGIDCCQEYACGREGCRKKGMLDSEQGSAGIQRKWKQGGNTDLCRQFAIRLGMSSDIPIFNV